MFLPTSYRKIFPLFRKLDCFINLLIRISQFNNPRFYFNPGKSVVFYQFVDSGAVLQIPCVIYLYCNVYYGNNSEKNADFFPKSLMADNYCFSLLLWLIDQPVIELMVFIFFSLTYIVIFSPFITSRTIPTFIKAMLSP